MTVSSTQLGNRFHLKLKKLVPEPHCRTTDLANEKGSSTQLTAPSLQDQDFNFYKQEACDALSLHCGWQLKNLPRHCVCDAPFSTDHAMACKHGGTVRGVMRIVTLQETGSVKCVTMWKESHHYNHTQVRPHHTTYSKQV